jgi:hypothetical protein
MLPLFVMRGNRARVVLGQIADVLRLQRDDGAFAAAMILKGVIRFVVINLVMVCFQEQIRQKKETTDLFEVASGADGASVPRLPFELCVFTKDEMTVGFSDEEGSCAGR